MDQDIRKEGTEEKKNEQMPVQTETEKEKATSEKKEEKKTAQAEEAFPKGNSAGVKSDPTQILTKLSDEERHFFLSLAGFSTFLKSTNRLFWTNFLMGLARGIGFVIGVSIVGAVCVTVWNEFLSVSGIGEFIARIIEAIHKSSPPSP